MVGAQKKMIPFLPVSMDICCYNTDADKMPRGTCIEVFDLADVIREVPREYRRLCSQRV